MSTAKVDANTIQAGYGWHRGQPGLIAPQVLCSGQSSAVLVANKAYVARFVPSKDMAVTLIAFVVTEAAGSDDKCDVGIYSSALGKIATSGETTGKLNSLGVKTISVAASLTAGTTYYAALAYGTKGSTAPKLAHASFVAGGVGNILGSAAGTAIGGFQETAFPLGSSITSGGGIENVPILGVRES